MKILKYSFIFITFIVLTFLLFIINKRNLPVLIKIPDKVIILPEGLTNDQFGDIFLKTYPDFDKILFTNLASTSQGYLFPDTYYFNSSSSQNAFTRLRDTFTQKTKDLEASTTLQNKNWNDIVIIASILEEEAKTKEDFKLVSGILWKRLSIDMPLQVDVATSTYKTRGLPEKPISNPGLDALDAALNPTPSPYLYYLTGKDGLMHYAKTFDEHKINIQKYLRDTK